HLLVSLLAFLFITYYDHRDQHSFPTRRSSDLAGNVLSGTRKHHARPASAHLHSVLEYPHHKYDCPRRVDATGRSGRGVSQLNTVALYPTYLQVAPSG